MVFITIHCFRWNYLSESNRSGLAVLDVGIPTGYIIQQQDLDAYILSRQVSNLQRARFHERKVLFYFDYVSILKYNIDHVIFFFFIFSWNMRKLVLILP